MMSNVNSIQNSQAFFLSGKNAITLIALHLQEDRGWIYSLRNDTSSKFNETRESVHGEHMEVLLAWNYILSQSCLQMNIFWLLTQSQVALCLTPDRVYIGQVQGINGQFELFFTLWHRRQHASDGIWGALEKKKSGCGLVQTNNQTGRKPNHKMSLFG